MANRDLYKEAIAEAKAVKEVAIANAKAALEESFTPHLKSMLAKKLEEMDNEEGLEEMDAPSFDRKSGASLDPDPKKVGQTTVQEKEEIEEEELDLDEILNELDLSEEDEDKEKMNEVEEDEAEEAEEDETGDDDEEIDLEDMSEDDLKSFIEDVIKDMVEAGELEAGEEVEDEAEEAEDEMEIEIEDEEEEVMEGKTEDIEEGDLAASATASTMRNEGEDMEEGYNKEIEELKKELQEVNLLNAKLLYTNKIFKAKTLSETKKLRVLKAFDKAGTVKEAKVIFETLNESLTNSTDKPSFKPKGMASKTTQVVMESKKPIIEVDPMVARWKKLAGLTND